MCGLKHKISPGQFQEFLQEAGRKAEEQGRGVGKAQQRPKRAGNKEGGEERVL